MLVPAQLNRPPEPNQSDRSPLGMGDVEEGILGLVVQQLVVEWLSTGRTVIGQIARISGGALPPISRPDGELLSQAFIDSMDVRNREVIELLVKRRPTPAEDADRVKRMAAAPARHGSNRHVGVI